MIIQEHVYIKGDVVSVGMRAWLKIQAKLVNVAGWARNAHDKPEVFGTSGGVEAVLQGEDLNVQKLIEIIKKGPPMARIDDVELISQEPKELFTSFEVKN